MGDANEYIGDSGGEPGALTCQGSFLLPCIQKGDSLEGVVGGVCGSSCGGLDGGLDMGLSSFVKSIGSSELPG